MPDPVTLTIAEKILGVVKALFGFKADLAKARVERRTRIAQWFENVAVCLDAVVSEIERGSYPSGRCGELRHYAEQLPEAVGEELGLEKSAQLSRTLVEAHQVERMYGERDQPSGKEELKRLLEAAGMLRGMSNSMRV